MHWPSTGTRSGCRGRRTDSARRDAPPPRRDAPGRRRRRARTAGAQRLDSLADEMARAGLPVRVHVAGDPVALPSAIDMSSYRIVQEGLTNALKHAGATRDVTVRYGRTGSSSRCATTAGAALESDGLGHGLVGVRERVKIYGGKMTARSGP